MVPFLLFLSISIFPWFQSSIDDMSMERMSQEWVKVSRRKQKESSEFSISPNDRK